MSVTCIPFFAPNMVLRHTPWYLNHPQWASVNTLVCPVYLYWSVVILPFSGQDVVIAIQCLISQHNVRSMWNTGLRQVPFAERKWISFFYYNYVFHFFKPLSYIKDFTSILPNVCMVTFLNRMCTVH
jgi:hypothetical protein